MKRLALAVVFAFAGSALAQQAAPSTVIKIGTLAPKESPWGQVFKVWQKAVKEKTKGAVELQFFWNGTQGDEAGMVGKMKTGQLDGAAVTAVGLGVIHRDALVLQIPGVLPTWAKLDAVRGKLHDRFDAAFRKAGFALVGWGDVGLDRIHSKGFALKSPADFKGKRPWVWREDPIAAAIYQAIGEVVPVPTGVPEVLPELSTGNINCMITSALASEQLQWSSRLDHISSMVVGPNIGAVVLASAKLEAMPKDQRDIVLETGKLATKALTDRIRKEDHAAFARLQKRSTVVEPADVAAWDKVFREARARLAQSAFPKELVEQVEQIAKQ